MSLIFFAKLYYGLQAEADAKAKVSQLSFIILKIRHDFIDFNIACH